LGYQLRRIALETGETMKWEVIDGKILPTNATAAETKRMVGRKAPITEEDEIILLAGRTNLRGFADELVIAHQFAGAIDLSQAGWLQKEAAQ